MFLLFNYLLWLVLVIYCFFFCLNLSVLCLLCCLESRLVCYRVSPVLPFTQISWPLTPTTWKQLVTLTSQVSGSVRPYLVARLVRLLRFTSSYGDPVFLPKPSSSAAASMLESAATSDRLSSHPSCPYCVVCPAPLFGLIHSSLSLHFLVYVLSINCHCLLICNWVPFLADS